jgi:hypothetical protein
MKTPKRICIFPKDIQLITGRSARYGCKVINEIKLKLKKEPHQFVTIYEFATYSGLDVELIKSFIKD